MDGLITTVKTFYLLALFTGWASAIMFASVGIGMRPLLAWLVILVTAIGWGIDTGIYPWHSLEAIVWGVGCAIASVIGATFYFKQDV